MNIWITLIIVIVTYVGIALGEFPNLKVNRTTITLIAVGALLLTQQITFGQIGQFLDLNTLVLLFGMMIVNANLQLAGFFSLAGSAILRLTHTPRGLLALEIIIAGFFSALFLNDNICLMLTPLILDITLASKRNPIPYLIALATASNIGSAATLTGNPQNMIIAIASKISYTQFALALTPIALLGMGSIWLVIIWLYPDEFRSGHLERSDFVEPRVYRPLLYKSLLVTAGLLIGFIIGTPVAESALIAACVLLLTRRVHPDKVLSRVDWNLMIFFSALFIVSGTMEVSGLHAQLFAPLVAALGGSPIKLAAVAVILSNLISNVPAVLLLKPIIPQLPDPPAAWLTLAATSTLAGNLTLLGSVANLIVAEVASRHNVKLTFWEYTRAGFIITIISILLGIVWLRLFIWK
ncbi:MAG TPA: anion transporter [Anaerolineales bacterium]|nr:anion transporter [Anaerolineales bacterium]